MASAVSTVRQQRRHGSERFHFMDGARRARISEQQKQRRHEGAAFAIGALDVEFAQGASDQVRLAL